MVRRCNVEKRREWEQRLGRFQSSGLTVGRFCQRENVPIHTFHYWARQIRSGASTTAGAHGTGSSSLANEILRRPSVRSQSAERSGPATNDTAVVRFLFDTGVQVSIPADCLAAIRCLVQAVQKPVLADAGSFHQVIVRDSSGEVR